MVVDENPGCLGMHKMGFKSYNYWMWAEGPLLSCFLQMKSVGLNSHISPANAIIITCHNFCFPPRNTSYSLLHNSNLDRQNQQNTSIMDFQLKILNDSSQSTSKAISSTKSSCIPSVH